MRYQGFNSINERLSSMYVERTLPEYTNADGEVVPALPMTFDLVCDPDEGKTRQDMAEDADVNVLMARFEKTGQLPPLANGAPQYFDASDVPDLVTAMSAVHEAERAFMTLPASVRYRFENDPLKFVEFAQDKDNLGQMREWGLAAPEKLPDPPTKVEIVNPPVAEKAP